MFFLFISLFFYSFPAFSMDQAFPTNLLFIRPIDDKNREEKIPITTLQMSAILNRLLVKKSTFQSYLTYSKPGSGHMHTNIFIDKNVTDCRIGRKDVPINSHIFQPFTLITLESFLSEPINKDLYVIDFSIICNTDKSARFVAGAINHVISHT